jgi:diamine N-acetyltransferase
MEWVSIREVTRENWLAALDLAVSPEQQRFVSTYTPIAAIALAKAYVRAGGLVWTPYAFYVNGKMVGFAALAYEPGSAANYWLRHFFVDRRYQARGYGRKALQTFIVHVTALHPACRAIQLTVHPENERARRLYVAAGFRPTGAEREGEPVYRLALARDS